jgi:hypothetical protein
MRINKVVYLIVAVWFFLVVNAVEAALPLPIPVLPISYITTDLNVGFPLEVAVPDGVIRVLIPTAADLGNFTSSGEWNDGVPKEEVLVVTDDYSLTSVICPTVNLGASDLQGFTSWTPGMQLGTIFYDEKGEKELSQAEAQVITSSGGVVNRYLAFTCRYEGTGAIGGQFALQSPSRNIQIKNLINPAAEGASDLNEALVLPGKIQLLRSGYTSGVATSYLVSDLEVKISTFTQEILVEAIIKPYLTFRIDGVPAGTKVCDNKTTSVGTNSLQINYGTLPLKTFVEAAQQVYVDSSTPNGYVVTLFQDHAMRQAGSGCGSGIVAEGAFHADCIANFGWDEGTYLTPANALTWTSTSKLGLGYTVKVSESISPSQPQAATKFVNGTKYSRLATQEVFAPELIASSETIARGDVYDVCYRIAVGTSNNAGAYTNGVVYTFTASF